MVDRAEGLRDVPLARVGRQALVARGTFRMIDRASALRKVPLGSAAPGVVITGTWCTSSSTNGGTARP